MLSVDSVSDECLHLTVVNGAERHIRLAEIAFTQAVGAATTGSARAGHD